MANNNQSCKVILFNACVEGMIVIKLQFDIRINFYQCCMLSVCAFLGVFQ